MEISNHYPYYTAKLAPDQQEQTTAGQQPQKTTDAKDAVMLEAEDRLELVRTQNLASPPPGTGGSGQSRRSSAPGSGLDANPG